MAPQDRRGDAVRTLTGPGAGLSGPYAGQDAVGGESSHETSHRGETPRWPLLLLALPAVVAIWSGWVGLGGMCGFGPVDLLPGIARVRVNTAVTLPVGMEVYAAYALRAWLAGGVPERARAFACRSSLAALGLGAAGQVAYHLMTAAGWEEAPWPVTIAVSCVPVAVLGMGAALAHLLREPGVEAGSIVVERATLREEFAMAAAALAPAGPVAPFMPEVPARPAGAEAIVYRLYGEPGDLLYVGCTVDPAARFRAHQRRQPWWDEVTASEVIWYQEMGEAAGAEQQAIFTEHPVYNIGTARYGYAAQVMNRREDAGAALVDPAGSVPSGPDSGGSTGRRFKVVQSSRPATGRARKGPGKPSDPRVGLRFQCGCGCGQEVSRMTLDRHAERAEKQAREAAEEAADLAVRAQSNGHREPVSAGS